MLPVESMGWYGWMAVAAIPAAVLAVVVPKRIGDRIPAVTFWVLPFLMFAAGFYRELEWFF